MKLILIIGFLVTFGLLEAQLGPDCLLVLKKAAAAEISSNSLKL